MEQQLSKDKLLQLYQTMFKIRSFEQKCMDLYSRGAIPGVLHVSIGQEGVSTGSCAALRPDDYITTTHRGHGDMIAKGADVGRMFAELFGRVDGYCRAKGGSMHIADPTIGVLGANGIVGAGLPIATGAGVSAKLRRSGQVCVCFFGDGAAANGTFHESLNMAALWRLPVIYVCHNNRWAQSVPLKQELSTQSVATMAGSYGIPGIVTDGQDVLSVYGAVSEAVERARRGDGPTLVEAKTYRWYGHHIGDADTYRPKDEVAEARSHDPVLNLKRHLLESGIADEGEIKDIETSVAQEIEAGVQFALASPEPSLDETVKDVYVGIEVTR